VQAEAIPFEYPKHFARGQIKEALKHIRLSERRNLPQLMLGPEKRGKCIIVGAAPSMKGYFDQIKERAENPLNALFAVNETHDWFIERGVIPKGAVVFEVSKELLHLFKRPHPKVTYFISSMCHPAQFRALEGYNQILWHPFSDVQEHIDAMTKAGAYFFVGGGSTTMLRTINIGLQLGYRDFELYGVDSSFEGESHLSGLSGDNGPVVDGVVDFNGVQTRFKTFAYLLRQVDEFRDWCEHQHHKFRMKVYGDGLLPFVHKQMFPDNYKDNV
jgi:hypothetical protein